MQPEDAELLDAMFWKLSSRTRYQRFFLPLDDPPPNYVQQHARRLAQTDSAREAALIALIDGEHGPEAVAVGRYARLETNNDAAEGALVVRDDYQGMGLGSRIFDLLVQTAMAQGIKELCAVSHADNQGVLALLRQLGMPYESRTSHGLQEFRLRVRDT
jgi:RimJ/RimL family protein N-acetyltransferase